MIEELSSKGNREKVHEGRDQSRKCRRDVIQYVAAILYLEVIARPGSIDATVDAWESLDQPHAPTYG